MNQKKGGILLSYVSMGANVLVKFLYTPILLRLLGQAEFGLYSLVISIVGYLAILDLGFGSTVTRYTVQYKSANDQNGLKRLYSTLSVIYIIIGIIAMLVCCGINIFSSTLFGGAMSDVEIDKLRLMIFLCGINLLFSFPLQISSSVLIAYERFIFKNAINMAKILMEPIVMLLLLYFVHIDSVGAIVVVTLFNLLGYLAFYIYSIHKLNFSFNLRYFDKQLIKKLLTFSVSMFLLMLFEQLQYNSGQFVLGMNYGTEVVAVWGVAMIFIYNYRSISSAITNVFMPSFFSLCYADNNSDTNKVIVKMSRIQCFILLTIMLNFIIFGYRFIDLWAGDGYQDAYYASVIVMIPMTLSLLLEFCYLYQMAKKKLTYRIVTLFSCFAISFLGVFFIFGISLLSFAWIMAMSIILGQIVCVIFFIHSRMQNVIKGLWTNILKVSSVPLLMTILFVILSKTILPEYNSIWTFISSIIVFNLLLFLCFWVFSMNIEERKMIRIGQ